LATHILVTAANLVAVTYSQATTVLLPADLATVAQRIKDDQNVTRPVVPGAFCQEGLLVVPNRGRLKIYPGDVVATDANGCVILVSAYSIATGGAWTYT